MKTKIFFAALAMWFLTGLFCAGAEEDILAAVAKFPISINYETFNTETANGMKYYDYPMFIYNGITYFPLSYYNCNLTGLAAGLEHGELTVTKCGADEPKLYLAERLGETDFKENLRVKKAPFKVKINGAYYDDDSYPPLFYKDVVYIPLTWQVAHEILGWEYTYGGEGLTIYTDGHYYSSSGDSYVLKDGHSVSVVISLGRTYYSKDGVRVYAATEGNRLGAIGQNMVITSGGVEKTVPGYTGYFQKQGALFSVDGGFIFTSHYDEPSDPRYRPCRINISTGEVIYSD